MIRVFTLSQIYANGLAYDFFRILLAPLAKVPLDDQRRSEWKRAGDALLAAKSSTPTEP